MKESRLLDLRRLGSSRFVGGKALSESGFFQGNVPELLRHANRACDNAASMNAWMLNAGNLF